jgi:MarR family transcriptional regulator, organic hydroperoxide resistance regulator
VNIVNSDLENFDFREWPFYWLTRAGGVYYKAMEEGLRGLGLDLPRWRVLMSLYQENRLSVSELADHAIVKLSTMTKIVQRMEQDGLVHCRPLADDRRVTEVVVTEAGLRAGEAAWQLAHKTYDIAFQGIPGKQEASLLAVLRRITENMERD